MSQRVFILRHAEAVRQCRALIGREWVAAAARGKPLTVVVAEHHERRSSRQNRLFHALLGEIAENVRPNNQQYDLEFWKELVRRRFIGTEEMTLPDGTRIDRGLSTASLSVGEFTDLIDRVTHWCVTELGYEPVTL